MGLGDTTGFVLSDGKSFHVNHSKLVCLPGYQAGSGGGE